MSGLTPTAAAMRAAGMFADQDLDIPVYARIVDQETGLPELIAAGNDVYGVLVEMLTNDTTPEGNKYYAATPEQSRRLFAAHEALTAALRIARDGRS